MPTAAHAARQLSCPRRAPARLAILVAAAPRARRLQPRRRRRTPARSSGARVERRAGRREARLPDHAPRGTPSASAAATRPRDAAGVASALFPATSESDRPDRGRARGQGRLAAARGRRGARRPRRSRAPMLLTDGGELPAVTADTLERLEPRGSDLSKDAQVIRIGEDAARPGGYKTAVIEGEDPYERAAAIDRFFSAARGRAVANVVVVSGEQAECAMPAAAWAARSGRRGAAGRARLACRRRREGAARAREARTSTCSAPRGSIGEAGRRASSRSSARSTGSPGPTPVENAIAFARYQPGRLRLGRGGARLQLHASPTPTRPLDARPRPRAGRERRVRPAAADRPRRRAAARARELLPRRPARLRGRPRPGRLQPRLDPRRRQGGLARASRRGSTRSPSSCRCRRTLRERQPVRLGS